MTISASEMRQRGSRSGLISALETAIIQTLDSKIKEACMEIYSTDSGFVKCNVYKIDRLDNVGMMQAISNCLAYYREHGYVTVLSGGESGMPWTLSLYWSDR